jgi:hypothetical protein
MKLATESVRQIIIGVVLSFVLVAGVSYVYAWTGPTAQPPNNNTPTPINVSATNQIKTGGLWVGSLGVDGGVTVGTVVTSPRYCIGTSCITSWPIDTTGGGGGITSLSAGTGIVLSPNPITTTGSVAADMNVLQRRVTGTCAVGSSISSIRADGTVTCETDDTGSTSISSYTQLPSGSWAGFCISHDSVAASNVLSPAVGGVSTCGCQSGWTSYAVVKPRQEPDGGGFSDGVYTCIKN